MKNSIIIGNAAFAGSHRNVCSPALEPSAPDCAAHDPWIASAAVIVLIAVSSAAGLIPAQRASRIDPILALRYE